MMAMNAKPPRSATQPNQWIRDVPAPLTGETSPIPASAIFQFMNCSALFCTPRTSIHSYYITTPLIEPLSFPSFLHELKISSFSFNNSIVCFSSAHVPSPIASQREIKPQALQPPPGPLLTSSQDHDHIRKTDFGQRSATTAPPAPSLRQLLAHKGSYPPARGSDTMAHQAKRPYAGTRAASQSAITSYFTQAASSSTIYETGTDSKSTRESLYSLPPQHQHSASSTPSLPHSVQSNLLNVGMRVRKSVPEGYKTGSYSAFTLFTDSNSKVNTNSAMSDTTTSPARKTRPRSGNRELTPFCGILKVGGMAGQQWGIYNPGNGGEMDEDSSSASEDEVPFLSSQGSTISSSSVDDAITPGGNKRRFFEDEEGHMSNSHVNFGFGSGSSVPVGERVLAVPKRKKWSGKVPVRTSGQVRIFGQENFNLGGSEVGRADVDFEDAEFLDYGLAGEVEMSGCN